MLPAVGRALLADESGTLLLNAKRWLISSLRAERGLLDSDPDRFYFERGGVLGFIMILCLKANKPHVEDYERGDHL